MTAFILVGGAWIGSWAWQPVTADLRRRGHEVYPLSLTGLAERVHLARPETDLETHITDVINLIRFEDLTEVALVGHSYAGSVIAGVADRIGERVSHVIYVDTAPLENGESLLDFYAELGDDGATERLVATDGDGWLLPPPPFADPPADPTFDGLKEADRQRLAERAVPHPFGTYRQKLVLTGEGEPSFTRAIVACHGFRQVAGSGLPRFAQFSAPDWRFETLETGHWPMLSMPEDLAAALDRIVS